MERFSAGEIAEIIRQTDLPQIRAIAYETLVLFPAQSMLPLLDDPLYADIAMQVLEQKGIEPVRGFMLRQIRDKDLELFITLSKLPKPDKVEQVPTHVVIPAFILSELRVAFQIGFLIYIPFLIVDMVVASVLMSMGMMMLSPMLVSLPFKIMLFVLVDGWSLLVAMLAASFQA